MSEGDCTPITVFKRDTSPGTRPECSPHIPHLATSEPKMRNNNSKKKPNPKPSISPPGSCPSLGGRQLSPIPPRRHFFNENFY